MSLTLATLLPGLVLIACGAALLANNSAIVSLCRSFPRSRTAALVCFGGGSAWYLYLVAHMSEADYILWQTPWPYFWIFAAIAVLAFFYVPDFLAVRGLSVLGLLSAWHLLAAAFQQYDHPQRLFLVTLLYLVIVAAIYLAAAPYRLRDFFGWLFAARGRARLVGGVFAVYGLLLAGVAFTY